MPAHYEPCRAQQEPESAQQELKPCPFCGKPAELTQDEHGAPMVACQWCLARVCGHSDTLAAYKWNWRTEDALRARAEMWEVDANTWRGFAIDVGRTVGKPDPDDVGIEDLRGLAVAVEQMRAEAVAMEQWRAFALEVGLQVAPLGEEQRAAQTTVRDLPALTEALREVVAERDRADQRADRAHAYKVVAENEAAYLRARVDREHAYLRARAEGAEADAARWHTVRDLVHKIDAEARPGGMMADDDVLGVVIRILRRTAQARPVEGALNQVEADIFAARGIFALHMHWDQVAKLREQRERGA